MHMPNACLNCVASSNPCIKYCRRSCRDIEQYYSKVWCKYKCHLRGHNSTKTTSIKILFPLCKCSMHVWTVLHVSNPCVKYRRRSCGDKNSTTVWYGQNMYVLQCDMVKICMSYSVIWSKYVCHSRGHNSAIMTWTKTLFFSCTCSMHVWAVV